MTEIKLSIDDENVDTLMSILQNLKEGLIHDIQANGKRAIQHTRYQAKVNTIIREEDSATNDTSGKYANASAYKQKLRNKK